MTFRPCENAGDWSRTYFFARGFFQPAAVHRLRFVSAWSHRPLRGSRRSSPKGGETAHATATVADGILMLTLPKVAQDQSRCIPIASTTPSASSEQDRMVSAVELARVYDAHVSALWRDYEAPASFGAWLLTHWHAGSVPLPATSPAAISPCGGGGRGIHWFDTPTAVLGCVPGADGCYLVPPDATRMS